MTPEAITVSQFLAIINETLAFAYPQVIVEGEVSSFKINQGKFAFFDLKDEHNVLACFMMAHQLKLPLEDGMKIRVTGNPKVTKFSKFSLTVRTVEHTGEGELKRAMELLRQRLEAEGLFAPERKRPLPAFPRTIGLTTSGTSAAYSDFLKVLNARWSGVDIRLADVTVQGPTAPDQIVAALEYFNTTSAPVDVIALIRGGGSLEDLAAFSTEPVARAVAASRTPIIVGVGHEIDTSLADYAADIRAATPTDAARLIVPDRSEITARVQHLTTHIETRLLNTLQQHQATVDQRIHQLERYLHLPLEHTSGLTNRLWRGFERLQATHHSTGERIHGLHHRLEIAQRIQLTTTRSHLDALWRTLRSYDPQATLNRGYAIVRAHGVVMRDPTQLSPTTPLDIQLAQGHLRAIPQSDSS